MSEKVYNRYKNDKQDGKYHSIINKESGDKSKTPKNAPLQLLLLFLP